MENQQQEKPSTPRAEKMLDLKARALQADRELNDEQKKLAAAYLSGMMAAQRMQETA